MKIAVIADSHDNLPLLEKALDIAGASGAQHVLHLGDVVSPFAARVLARCGIKTLAVFGNNDGEKAGLAGILDIQEPPRRVQLSGRSILMAHDASKLPVEAGAAVELLLCGHSHKPEIRKTAGVLRVNPGECGGWLYASPSFAIIDLDGMEAELLDL